MEKATEKQIQTIEWLLAFKTQTDERFLKMQGYFINNAKKNMTKQEANQIIKYINNKKGLKPSSFNKFICFDYGWNKRAIEALGLASNSDGLPYELREQIIKKQITKKEALEKVQIIAKERSDYLDWCINEFKK